MSNKVAWLERILIVVFLHLTWKKNTDHSYKIISQNKMFLLPTYPILFQHVIGNRLFFLFGLRGWEKFLGAKFQRPTADADRRKMSSATTNWKCVSRLYAVAKRRGVTTCPLKPTEGPCTLRMNSSAYVTSGLEINFFFN